MEVVYVAAPSRVRISKNWRKISEIYKLFGKPEYDYSEQAAEEMYLFETRGEGDLSMGLFTEDPSKINGYAVGKRWMNVHIEMWREGMREGTLFRFELEPHYPAWFLDKFLGFPPQRWPLDKEATLAFLRGLDDGHENKGEAEGDEPHRHDRPALDTVDRGVQEVGERPPGPPAGAPDLEAGPGAGGTGVDPTGSGQKADASLC